MYKRHTELVAEDVLGLKLRAALAPRGLRGLVHGLGELGRLRLELRGVLPGRIGLLRGGRLLLRLLLSALPLSEPTTPLRTSDALFCFTKTPSPLP